MSLTHNQRISLVAVATLVAALPVLWQLGEVRSVQAIEAQQQDLVDQTVPTRLAPADYDEDGVSDATDRCPTRAETVNGFQDGDGCPDVVATTGAS